MDLASARQQIEQSFARMDALYLRPLFDEWAILSLAAQQGILAYSGPRAESFRKEFPDDVAPLRAMIAGRPLSPGEFRVRVRRWWDSLRRVSQDRRYKLSGVQSHGNQGDAEDPPRSALVECPERIFRTLRKIPAPTR